ncbi:MAG: hypothetical protein ACREDR_28480 [Blastocatellia bacterium]
MQTLDPAWAAYLGLQNIIARRPIVDDYSYGLETGLNRFIELQSNLTNLPFDATAEASRAVASGRRTSNRRRHLDAKAKHQFGDDLRVSIDASAEDTLDARQRLRRIFFQTGKTERVILYATAIGHDGAVIAAFLKLKPATFRKRLDRLRKRLAA